MNVPTNSVGIMWVMNGAWHRLRQWETIQKSQKNMFAARRPSTSAHACLPTLAGRRFGRPDFCHYQLTSSFQSAHVERRLTRHFQNKRQPETQHKTMFARLLAMFNIDDNFFNYNYCELKFCEDSHVWSSLKYSINECAMFTKPSCVECTLRNLSCHTLVLRAVCCRLGFVVQWPVFRFSNESNKHNALLN